MNWNDVSILERETNKRSRWIREAIQVRKLSKDIPMNRDEGGYQLPHLWDPLLRNPPKPPAGRHRLRRSWHTPYRVCAGGGPRGGHRLFHQARRITACHSNNSSAGSPKQFRSSDDGMLYTAIETSAKGKSFSVCQMKIQLLWYTGYHRNEIVFCNCYCYMGNSQFQLGVPIDMVIIVWIDYN